jgi:hypothetical protein
MTKNHTTNRIVRYLTDASPVVAAIALAFSFSACSSVKTHVDKGPIHARTFSFLNTGSRPTPDYAETSQQAHALIQQALIHNFAARGVSHVDSGGDITVAYLVIASNNATTTSLNEYFGYTDEASAMVEQVHKEETGNQNSRAYFEAGTLVIDVLDPKTSKLLQRRSIQGQILRNLPLEKRTERVQAIVDQALANLPVSP